jgi:hypothetical protein
MPELPDAIWNSCQQYFGMSTCIYARINRRVWHQWSQASVDVVAPSAIAAADGERVVQKPCKRLCVNDRQFVLAKELKSRNDLLRWSRVKLLEHVVAASHAKPTTLVPLPCSLPSFLVAFVFWCFFFQYSSV